MIIFIIFVIGLVIILIYVLTKEKEEDEEEYFNSLKEARRREKRIEQEKILEDIRNKSKPLLNLIKSNYELKYWEIHESPEFSPRYLRQTPPHRKEAQGVFSAFFGLR